MRNVTYLLIIAILLTAGVSLLALPSLVRALPGRYASLLPEPLQQLRHSDHPMVLPTPDMPPLQIPVQEPTETPPPSPTPSLVTPSTTPPPTPPNTESPTNTPQPTPTPSPTLPTRVLLENGRHERQGWNNCGPTTLAMTLSFWGSEATQSDIAPLLKPDPEDKHVGIDQMADYAAAHGLQAIVRSGGTLEGVKRFLHAGIPVIIETWYVRDARDQLGHYRLVVGYDEASQLFDLYDSLYDPPTTMAYRELYELWRVFDWTYLVVAPPDRWDTVLGIVGSDVDDGTMYQAALERASAEAEDPASTCVAYATCADWVTFSWYTVGTNFTALGRHEEASEAYDRARQRGLHYRMLWYQFGPYESYYAVERYQDVIALADATLATAPNLEESYLWRARARLATGDTVGARADAEAALKYHPDWEPATLVLAELVE